MSEGAAAPQMPLYHGHGVAPLRQLVASLEVVHDFRTVRAAHLHEKVEAVVHHVGHERFHVVIAQFTGRVQVLQFFRVAEAIVRHLLG